MATDCRVQHVPPRPMVSIRGDARASELSQTIGTFLGEVFRYVSAEGGEIAGMPFTRIHGTHGETVDVEAGLPLKAPLPGSGRVQSGELPGGTVVSMDHFGDYGGLPGARAALRSWAATHKYSEAGPPWEMYWTDPGAEPDPAKWKTEIVMPVRTPPGGDPDA